MGHTAVTRSQSECRIILNLCLKMPLSVSVKKSQNVPFFAIVLNPAFVGSETSDDDFQKHKFTLLSLDPHTCI